MKLFRLSRKNGKLSQFQENQNMTLTNRFIVSVKLCPHLRPFRQLKFAKHNKKYASIIIIFNFRCLL